MIVIAIVVNSYKWFLTATQFTQSTKVQDPLLS